MSVDESPASGAEREAEAARALTLCLAGRALDLAVLPALERQDARALLDDLAPVTGTRAPADEALFPLRLALVGAAGRLLAPDLPADVAIRIARGRFRQALMAALEARCLGDAGPDERAAQRALEQDAVADPEVAALVQDVRDFAAAPVDQLLDAHRLVRLHALVRMAVDPDRAGSDVLAAARALLGLAEAEMGALLDRARSAAREPDPEQVQTPGPELRARQTLHQRLFEDLAGLPIHLDPEPAAEAISTLAGRHLGTRACLALCPDPGAAEPVLVLHGLRDLAGQTLRLDAGRSLAARCLLDGTPGVDALGEGGAVIDRQIARRLGADALIAVPIQSPGPLAVLIADARADRYAALALAMQIGPRLELLTEVGRRLAAVDSAFRSRYERRLREVVHEANNPLSVIHNYLHLLGTRLDDESSGKEQLRRIGGEIRRTGEIIGALVDIPGQVAAQDPERGGTRPGVALDALVEDVIGLLEPALMQAAGISVQTELDPSAGELTLDAGRLRQILLNLLKNAVEAMPDGGTLRIATRGSVMTDRGRRIEIRITDSGPGIPADLLAELFSAGSTTKGAQRGLGLHIVRRLVDELGGTISADSSATGTTFRVLLPR